MDPTGIVKETGKATQTFFSTLKDQPLSLALVVMNFVLLGFLFYNGATISSARQETVKLILGWQQQSDTLMANCVSKAVLDSVVAALERQLQGMKFKLDDNGPPPLPRPKPEPDKDQPGNQP